MVFHIVAVFIFYYYNIIYPCRYMVSITFSDGFSGDAEGAIHRLLETEIILGASG